MPSSIIAAIGAAVAGFAAGATAATIAINAALAFAGSFVLGQVSKALTKKPKAQDFSGSIEARDRTVTIRQPIAPRRVIYGQVRTGGVYVFIGTSPQGDRKHGFLHLVIALAGHEVEEIGDIYFDDKRLSLEATSDGGNGFRATSSPYSNSRGSFVYLEKHLGSPDQVASAQLVGRGIGWTDLHRLRGIAYLYVQLQYDPDIFPNGVPNITAVVKGKKVFDPRDEDQSADDQSTWTWSDNPALCVADYLCDQMYGMAADYATEISEADLIAAANICDEQVELVGGGGPTLFERRYTCNGSYTSDTTPKDIIEGLLTSMAGSAVLIGGKWYIDAGAYKIPTIELDENDLRGGIKTRNLVPARESFNSIKGTFVSPANLYQPDDFPPIISDVFAAQDGGEVRYKDITLEWTTSSSMAQRLAKIDLLRSRQSLTTIWECKLTAWRLRPGDTVMLTNARHGWSRKVFEVSQVDLAEDESGYLGVNVTFRETASNVYDWSTSEEETYDPAPNSELPSPFDVGSPSNLMAESGEDQLLVLGEGSIISRILFSWDEVPDAFIREYEVEVKRSSDDEWTPYAVVRRATEIHISPVEDGESYDLRVRGVNEMGVRSEDWATLEGHVVIGKTEAPPAPDTFTVERTADGTRRYAWSLDDEPADVRSGGGYRIRYFNGETSDWDSMIPLHNGLLKASPYESNELAAGSYTFAIKTVDSSGNESATAKFVSVTLGDPRLRNVLLARSEHTLGWPGEKIDCYVDTDGALRRAASSGSPQGDWSSLSGSTWNALSGRTWAEITERGALTYTTPIIDLGANVGFTPVLSFVGGGATTIRIATGQDGQSPTVDAFEDMMFGHVVTNRRYVQLEITATEDISQLTILLDGDTQVDEFPDVDVATESAIWFEKVGNGHFRIGTRSQNMAAITMATIDAIQNAGGRATWELISKSVTVGGSPGVVAAEFKTYDAAGSPTDYVVDVTLKGPKIA